MNVSKNVEIIVPQLKPVMTNCGNCERLNWRVSVFPLEMTTGKGEVSAKVSRAKIVAITCVHCGYRVQIDNKGFLEGSGDYKLTADPSKGKAQ